MMRKEINFVKTSINLPEDLRDQLKIAAVKRKVAIQEVIADLLRIWLRYPTISKSAQKMADDLEYEFHIDPAMASRIAAWIIKNTLPASSPEQPAQIRWKEWIDKLLYILESESKDAIQAVQTNINVFHRLARVDESKRIAKEVQSDSDLATGTDHT